MAGETCLSAKRVDEPRAGHGHQVEMRELRLCKAGTGLL
jgi:hypothetical protein